MLSFENRLKFRGRVCVGGDSSRRDEQRPAEATHRMWGMPREDRMSEAATHRTWGMPREDRMSEAAALQEPAQFPLAHCVA